MGEPAPAASLLHSEPEIERALIGRIIAGWGTQRIPPPQLAPSRFCSVRNSTIWAAILDAHRKGEPYDLPALVSRLKAAGHLADAGGAAYVAALLTGKEGSPDSIDFYVQKIRQAAARRALGPLGNAVAALALADTAVDPPSLKARYQTLVRRADAVCDMASRNGHNPTLTLRSVHQILTSPPDPLKWTYDPWLGAGDVVILAGEPGLGKSWLALDLMFRLGLGREWCGIPNSSGRQQRVLYVDEENNYRLVRHRIGRLVDGLDIGFQDIDPANFLVDYALENGVNLDDEASLEQLRKTLERLRPDWIILDSLVRIHRRDENSNAEMASLIGGVIKPMARAAGAGAIIIHHLAKPTKDRPSGDISHRIRGASDIMGVADQVWGLERTEDKLRLTHIKCRMDRASGPIEVDLEDTHAGNGVLISGRNADKEASSIVYSFLESATHTPTSRQSIVEYLESESFSAPAKAATRALGKLYSDGRIKKRRDGKSITYWTAKFAPGNAT